ncbi:potassium transporter Kup [Xinfangfangia sp. CPCC 101601]|uniref:Probable potassium transport system protein Kup n=1 Tax=Pseudogemmobacter lacusdianii TaxID=3069608 RepID=A0ABU0VVP1_9RHOB|nr:potassium transporter Kup [Xinfangfangia sp. CPCC 101601]MDQ2065802.1 potassium transporter Kup [Xinfangfangia sp. CPCC 101601]
MTDESALFLGPKPVAHLSEDALDIADYLRAEADADADIHNHTLHRQGIGALALGALGVVYGDIGTSPLYAFREALRATGVAQPAAPEVLGLLSLLIWTLLLIVTVKYVFVLLRADNRGEGGILSLYTLVRLAIGRRSIPILLLAMAGAALFAGDAAITPAISVLSAVEGMGLILPQLEAYVLPVTLGILVALFMVQRQGTARVAQFFGPVMLLWFAVLAGMGLWHLAEAPMVLWAVNPAWGISFLIGHPGVAFVVLGAIFLAVTGGEALYADLGHFGRKPISWAWFGLVLPALVLNYLGQGALVLSHPETAENPFYSLASAAFLPVLVGLATAATVIAAQAVITGAFSMARAAVQLGFLPRLRIVHTAEGQSGQIYIGAVNWLLLAGVIWLVVGFGTSTALASAYGIAVTGTMVLTTVLGLFYLTRVRGMPLAFAVLLTSPILLIEMVFLASNLTKIHEGGYVPVLVALVICGLMWIWWRGTQAVKMRVHRLAVTVPSFVQIMRRSSVHRIPGTAFFLTGDPEIVPSALLHNMKHNRVLHEQTVFLTVETLRVPYATAEERAFVEDLGGAFTRVILRFGFMETPNISRAMAHARRAGLRFDVMTSTFFLGRRRAVATGQGLELSLDRAYVAMSRFAADPSDFYHLPRDRVVELGERVAI